MVTAGGCNPGVGGEGLGGEGCGLIHSSFPDLLKTFFSTGRRLYYCTYMHMYITLVNLQSHWKNLIKLNCFISLSGLVLIHFLINWCIKSRSQFFVNTSIHLRF
jgi:hypothetical protein